MANETEANKELKQNYTVKDKWDKLEIVLHPIGGLFTGLAIAALGYFGSAALEERQTNEINMRLYSELMNQREQAENKLRSDMFQQIFDSFLAKTEPSQQNPQNTKAQANKDQSKNENGNNSDATNEIIIDRAHNLARDQLKIVSNDLLRLELLTRNFHESIDIKPIFHDILFKILKAKRPLESIICTVTPNLLKKTLKDKNENPQINLVKQIENYEKNWTECEELKESKRHTAALQHYKEKFTDSVFNETLYGKTAELLNQTKRKITKLRTIAHRISDKQLENLANKSNFLKITIPMNDLCDDQRPPSPPKIPEAPETPETPETSDKLCDKPKGYTKTIMLTMNANNRKYQRIFDIKITHSYTKWNQVYVTVKATKPREDISCGEDYKENELDIHNTCAEFWVSSFDFPLVDNTYLSEDERYGIAIDGIDEKEGKITLVLVYFPASYAGLKEKSFYHKKVLNHLNNWIVIKGDKD